MNHFPNSNLSLLTTSLFKLCDNKSTGTLFVLTNHKTCAQFVINDGEITDLSFNNKKGLSAISEIENSLLSKTHFIEDYHFPLSEESKIHNSENVLRQLGYYQSFKEVENEEYLKAV